MGGRREGLTQRRRTQHPHQYPPSHPKPQTVPCEAPRLSYPVPLRAQVDALQKELDKPFDAYADA